MRASIIVCMAVSLVACAGNPSLVRPSDTTAGVYFAPEAIARDEWLHDGDVPTEALPSGPALVGSAITVRPDGSVQDCQTDVTSNNPEIDDYTCDILKRRARFRPGHAPDGTKMYGVFRTWTEWGGPVDEKRASNFKVITNLPANSESTLRVDIMFLVDADGRPTTCTDQHNDDDPVLVGMACRRLAGEMATPAVRNEAGLAVPSVQDATVLFVEHGQD